MSAPVLVTWTDRRFCSVCNRSGLVSFRWFDGRVRGHGVMACPHSPTDPREALPVLCVPWRVDIPREEAA